MYPVPPGIPECLDLFRFPGDVIGLAVFDVPAGGGPLEIGVELDAVGGIKIDALDLVAQSFALGQGGHDLEAVPQDHAVLPFALVLVKFGFGPFIGQPVEICKKVELLHPSAGPSTLSLPLQIVDEHLGMDFFLDIQGRGMNHQIRPILPILAPPDQLGVKIRISSFFFLIQTHASPGIGNLDRDLKLFFHYRLIFSRGNVFACGILVGQGFYGFQRCFFLGHYLSCYTLFYFYGVLLNAVTACANQDEGCSPHDI